MTTMTTSPEPPNPIFKLLDRVLDSREPECMWISAKRGYEDVTKVIHRGRYELGHWYKDPKDQYAKLVNLHTEPGAIWNSVIWKVDQRLVKTTPMFSLGMISLSAFIAVSKHFPSVCVVRTTGATGAWDSHDDHEIMLFDEVDAIAAVAFLADHGQP